MPTGTNSIRSDDDEDELLLIGAVVWDLATTDPSGDDNDVTSKIRVHRRDVSNGSICRGRDLQRILQAELPSVLPHQENVSSMKVQNMEIYDKADNIYVSILDEPNLAQADLTQRFGTRLRIHLSVVGEAKSHAENACGGSENHTYEPPKAIMGRYYSYNDAEGLEIAGVPLRVHEISNQETVVDTGVNVWDGALLLAQYLEKNPSFVRSKRVLELGSGCGLVGLAAGVLGAKQVLMTDLPYALANMEDNTNRHAAEWRKAGCEEIVCAALDWYHPPSLQELGAVMNNNDDMPQSTPCWVPDLILIADCVWMQELVEPLLATIQHLTQQSIAQERTTRVLLSYQQRGKSTHEEFWNGLHSDRFPNATVTEVDVAVVGLSKPDSMYLLLLDFGQ